MYQENKQFYPLHPLTFVVVGLILLISVILLHDYINYQPARAVKGHSTISQSVPVPQEVLGEVVNNNKNLSKRTLEFQQAGRSIKFLYQSSPDFFITQN